MKITDFILDINATYPVITQTDEHTYSELKGYELEKFDNFHCAEVDFSMVDGGVVRDIIEGNFFDPEAITKIIVVADVEKTTVYYIGVYAE